MNDHGLIKALETFGEGIKSVRVIKVGDTIDLEVGHLTVQLEIEKRAVEYWRTECDKLKAQLACANDFITQRKGSLLTQFSQIQELTAELAELKADRDSWIEHSKALLGWQLVPIEPTQAMCQAAQDSLREWPKFPFRVVPAYKSMLKAAPKAAP